MHVERTSDERVVRWVTHLPRLADSCAGPRQPAPDSAVGALLGAGVIDAVAVSGGDVLIQSSAAWPTIVAEVDAAVRSDLAADAPWWLAPSCSSSCSSGCAGAAPRFSRPDRVPS